jgi:hypothetical protein
MQILPLSTKVKDAIFLTAVYLAMLAGMCAKTLFDHLARNVPLELKGFLVPLVVSPLVYGTVFHAVKDSQGKLVMLIFGFQNGFFWQDIFGQIKGPAIPGLQ